MKLLHIDSSITGDHSVSRELTAAIVARLTAADPSLSVIRRDLAADVLPHLDLASLPGDTGEAAIASAAVLDEFLSADIMVIGAPMYNFTVPTQLKAWFDRILVAGRTFTYTAEGPQGLAGPKRVIVAVSRGGFYGAGSPAAAAEHVETYLSAVFGF
ncbi:MAG: NAD(P)H-dependent oxidoreductase, partial [Sphingobium sp.]